MTKLIAYITSLLGLALMAFGIWGLQAPQKVSAAVSKAQTRFFSVSRAATSIVRNQMSAIGRENEVRKPVTPVSDPNFVPVTIEEKYSKYLFCMTSEKPCPGFTTDTEGAYYNDLREQMQRELSEYHAYLKVNPLKIQKADEDFARQLLREATADIQTEALKVISLFPPERKNLVAVTRILKDTRDERVLDNGLNVLTKFRGDSEYDILIADTLAQQISRGTAENTSIMAARRLFPFITQHNALRIRKLQQDLNYLNAKYGVQSERMRAVNLTLREYERGHLTAR
jgi:hypothetical protein